MQVENKEGDYHAENNCHSYQVTGSVDELRTAFEKLVDARQGKPFDIASIAELMDGFNMLCTGY